MNHVDGTFKGVRNIEIYYQGWVPAGEVKAVLFIVHGVGEYVGRYTNVVNHFVPLGYSVYGVDHIGHGKSGGDREMIERFEDYTQNLEIFYKMVQAWQPGKPVIIYGHSMGGLIASLYLIDHQDDFKAGILSAAAAKVPDNINGFTIAVAKLLSKIAPSSGMIGLDTNYLSHDKAVVNAYNTDPQVFHGKMPVRLSAEMLRAMMRVAEKFHKVTLPLFILHGGGDKIVEPEGGKLLYEKAGSTDKTLKIYEGLYHEVHNEPEREVMFKDLEEWLEARLN